MQTWVHRTWDITNEHRSTYHKLLHCHVQLTLDVLSFKGEVIIIIIVIFFPIFSKYFKVNNLMGYPTESVVKADSVISFRCGLEPAIFKVCMLEFTTENMKSLTP